MFTKSKNILFTTMSVLTLGLGTAHADCYQEVLDSEFNAPDKFEMTFVGGISTMSGAFLAAGSGLAAGSINLGLGAMTTSIHAYDYLTDLNESEEYAAKVIYGATYEMEPGQSPILASFIKNVKREIGQDPNAVIPTDYEVIEEIKQINYDRFACTDENGDFVRPTKESLTFQLVKNLSY